MVLLRRKGNKWKATHADWIQKQSFKHSETSPELAKLTPDELCLHLPRERDGWWSMIRTVNTPSKVVADISQSLGRMPSRTDGALPTITPGGHIIVAEAGRCVLPIEKIMLHALPVHRLKIPHDVSDKEISDMGGNMMHLQTVGVAMVLAMSLVDWLAPSARQPRAAPAAAPAFASTSTPNISKAAKPSRQRKRSSQLVADDLKLKRALKARFGLTKSRVKKSNSKTAIHQKKKPKHIACLRGTRWACGR